MFESARKKALETCATQERLVGCEVVAEATESDSRPSLKDTPKCVGNFGVSGDIEPSVEDMVRTNDRSVCEQKMSRDTSLLQSEKRSSVSGGQFQSETVARQGLCLSSNSSHPDGCEQDREGQGEVPDPHHTQVARGPLVGADIRDAHGQSNPSASDCIVPGGGSENPSHLSSSGVPCVRNPAALSDAAKHLINADIRKSTKKVYDARFAIFQQYCVNVGCDPFTCDTSHILNFLATKYEEGGSYQTINGFRSAISKYHVGTNAIQVGNLPLVKRLVKGVFQEKPPMPRYAKFWDVSQLLEFLKTLHPPSSLSVQCLGQKTLALLSLCSVCRVSSVSKLSAEYNVFRGENGDVSSIIFYLCGLEKTSRPGNVRKEIKVPIHVTGYEEDSLNLFIYLKAYLEATSDRRDLSSPNSMGIFISNTQVSILVSLTFS